MRAKTKMVLLTLGVWMATPLFGTKVIFALHGGTGVPKASLSKEEESAYRKELQAAAEIGFKKLRNASGLDAIEAAVRYLEDCPLFNAGKGSVFTWDGRNELDASIMEGKEKRAGAIGGVTIIRNPISAARAVMEKSEHVFLTGRGAEVFAATAGVETVDPSYFFTERRWKSIKERWQQEAAKTRERGTVGAVAIDSSGNLVAGTSTGGMTGKRYGRFGDSPVIGAGTYADNAGAAVSGTGWGEYFIRFHVAGQISDLIKWKQMTPEAAAKEVIVNQVAKAGGDGGVIVLDRNGNYAGIFHGDGLYRAWVTDKGKIEVALY